MSVAGFKTVLRRSGTSTVFGNVTPETMKQVGDYTYQIDDFSLSVWDRSVVPTFYDDAVEIDSSDIVSIDFLFGKVELAEGAYSTITATGNYIPLLTIGGANSFTLNEVPVIHETTELAQDEDYRERMKGIMDANISLSRWEKLDNIFLDTSVNVHLKEDPIFIQIYPGGKDTENFKDMFRGWFIVESKNSSGGFDDLESSDLSFQLDSDNEDNDYATACGWGKDEDTV